LVVAVTRQMAGRRQQWWLVAAVAVAATAVAVAATRVAMAMAAMSWMVEMVHHSC